MIKLLHVEDDADIREIVDLALGLSGEFNVVQCESGEAAIACIKTYAPDVILLDMMMPSMTGRQTLEKIRESTEFASIPAIFMTARAQQAEIDQLLQVGKADVITKPFDPMTLSDQIKHAMQKALSRSLEVYRMTCRSCI